MFKEEEDGKRTMGKMCLTIVSITTDILAIKLALLRVKESIIYFNVMVIHSRIERTT